MKLPNWLKKSKSKNIETKAQSSSVIWPLQEGSFLEYALGHGGRLTAEQAMGFYQNNSTVATAVDKIATKIEQITPILKVEGDNILVNKHELLDLLKNPNPFDTWQEFIGKIARHYLLTHDSYLSMLGNFNRPPLEVYAIKPQNVFTTQAIDFFPAAYNVTIGAGVGNYLRTEEKKSVRFLSGAFKEFYHIKGFSSRSDELHGDSPLEAAALETRQQIKGRTHNISLLDNGGRLSLIVAFKDDDAIEDDEHKARKRRINEDLGGSDNAGNIAVISGAEVDIKEAGTSNKDMDYAELDKTAGQNIYLRYEIPLPLVSLDASTYNNIESALLDFYENTILPLVDILFAGIQKAFSQRYNLEGLKLTYDPESIKILIRQTLKEIKERRAINIETVNELRTLLPNRESIDGGEVLYQPSTLVPIGEDLFTEDELTPEELAEQLAQEAEAD